VSDWESVDREVVAIIGASGSGTTPFLRCINLLEEYQQDRIDTVEELPTGEWGDEGAVPEPLAVPKTRRERDEHAGTRTFS